MQHQIAVPHSPQSSLRPLWHNINLNSHNFLLDSKDEKIFLHTEECYNFWCIFLTQIPQLSSEYLKRSWIQPL